MSIKLMTLVWDIDFPTQSQKLLMLKLADYASDDGGSVFPATETLADKAGCDERTAQRAMRAFRDCGLVHLVKQGGGGPKATNEWKLNVQLITWLSNEVVTLAGASGVLEIEGTIPEDKGDKLPGVKGDIKGGNLSARVTNDALRAAICTSKGDTTATQSVNNHQLDSSCAGAHASAGAARTAPAPKTGFTICQGDMSWDDWMRWLSDRERRDLVAAAQEAGQLVAVSKWPTDSSPIPRIPQAAVANAMAQELAKRMTGER